MSIHRRLLLVGFALVLAVAAVAALSVVSSAKQVLEYDLDLNSQDVSIVDDTWEVHGNVTVRIRSSLTLTRATLILVGPSNGSCHLDVENGSKLLAYNSTILGSIGTIGVHLVDGCYLENTTIEHIETAGGSRGLALEGGDIWLNGVEVVDCPNGTAILVRANLTATDCAFRQLGSSAIRVVPVLYPLTVRLTNCTFEGGPTSRPDACGLFVDANSSDSRAIDVVVQKCTFQGLPLGVLFQANASWAGLHCADSHFTDCGEGLVAIANYAQVTVQRCTVSASSADVGIGIEVPESLYTPITLVADNLTVQGCERGVYIIGPVNGFRPKLTGLNVSLCTYGVAVLGSTVAVEDSRVLECDYCFEVEQKGHIDVRRTEHEHRSGTVASGQEGAVVAYSTVNVTDCSWKGAQAITAGTLYLWGDDGIEVGRVDISAPAPVEVIAWSRSRWNDLGRAVLIPTFFADATRFEAANFSVYDTSAQRVELVDNRTPVISGVWPPAGHWYATNQILVTGHVSDLGSGLAGLNMTIVDWPFHPQDVYFPEDGNWTYNPFIGGSSLTFSLLFRATDRAGGVTTFMLADLHVDLEPPTITLDPGWRTLINTSIVVVEGMTEPFCNVTLGNWACFSNATGHFAMSGHLEDGPYTLELECTDRAGNSRHIIVEFLVDTRPPDVWITRPTHGEWLNTSAVEIDGGLEAGASLWVAGAPVPLVPGWTRYAHLLNLSDGQYTVIVMARDEAGNAATANATFHVDTTPPVIDIAEPVGDRIFTIEETLSLKGDVIESDLERLTLNGLPIEVLDGFFARVLQIGGGENIFILIATDMAGNRAEQRIVVLKDVVQPAYEVDVEDVGGRFVTVEGGPPLATSPTVRVTFRPSEWVRVTVRGGLGIAEGAGPLALDVALKEGFNEIVFAVVDEAGNEGPSYALRAVLDTTPPSISITEPLNGSRTKDMEIRVRGTVEPGSTVKVKGVEVAVAGDGSFSTLTTIAEGPNIVHVQATDRVGLVTDVNFTITREASKREDQPGLGHMAAIVAMVAAAAPLAFASRRRER